MAEESTYTVTVKPVGVSLDDARDTREFEFTTEASHPDAVESDAVEHIIKNRLIDPTTFRSHWEVGKIVAGEEAPDDTSAPTLLNLKNELAKQTPADVNRMQSQANTNYTTYFEDGSGNTHAVTFVVLNSHYQSFDQWLSQLVAQHAVVRNASGDAFGEAMVRTIADAIDNGALKSSLINDFRTVRASHDRFIRTVMRHESTLLSHLNSIGP